MKKEEIEHVQAFAGLMGLLGVMLFVFLALVLPFQAHASDLQVSGAGTSDANGCYVDQGNIGEGLGSSWHHQTTGYVLYTAGALGVDTYCRIASSTISQYYYYDNPASTSCTSAIFAAATYTVDAGSVPSPTVAETTCTSGGGDSSIGGATSTTEQAQENLGTGFFIFLIAFFGVVWLAGNKH